MTAVGSDVAGRQGRRSRRVDERARRLRGLLRGSGGPTGRAPAVGDDEAGRRDDAAGDDRALPRALHLSAEARRRVPRARGRGRRGPAADADRQDARRARHHHRLDRGQGRVVARGRRRSRRALHEAGFRGRGEGLHRAARARRSSTTRSGRRRSRRASTRWCLAACSCSSGSRAVWCLPSIRSTSARKGRCSLRGRRSSTTSRRATSCRTARAIW